MYDNLQQACGRVLRHLDCCRAVCADTVAYYACLIHFILKGSILSGHPFHKSQYEQVHLYSLARTLKLWREPHYRSGTTQRDFYSNLVNVAIPGTGLPLSLFALHELTLLVFLFVMYPLTCLAFSIYLALLHSHTDAASSTTANAASTNTESTKTATSNTAAANTAVASTAAANTATASIAAASTAAASAASSTPAEFCVRSKYAELLLQPTHWFALWRLNCLLVAWHSHATGSDSYSLEDKGQFLLKGAELGLPVTPVLQESAVVLKHKNMEGGLGIHFFKNFVDGGDWIIQPVFRNSEFLRSILPDNAPLSTLRVITASRIWLNQQKQQRQQQFGSGNRPGVQGQQGGQQEEVQVFTVVLRAGFSGASTDHNSICFDVDPATGLIGQGLSNQHWYKIGLHHVLRPGPTFLRRYSNHPNSTKPPIEGQIIPSMPNMLKLITASHRALVPDVPLVGWDVALTDSGVYVLEINISCNFFDGKYDHQLYTQFLYDHFVALEALDKAKEETAKEE